MKRLAIIFTLALFSTVAFAQGDAGLFGKGETDKEAISKFGPGLPGHGETGDQPAPAGSGVALLIGFGAAYAMWKRNKK